MAQDVYAALARHLDRLPGGFPATESGVELRILRRLFTEEEATLALRLTLLPEEARVVARRAGLSVAEAATRLEGLARKGLAFSIERPGKPAKYMAAQYVVGIWEYHVNDLDPELIRDMNEYLPRVFDTEVWRKAPQLRTIPVGRSIPVTHPALPYEQADEILRAQKKILVAPCICRREHKMAGAGCDRPEEACLVFGLGAEYYERNGLGRMIELDEALAILRRAEQAGLVLQPGNAQRPLNICCCCGCCCQVLKNLARHPRPADLASSPYRVELAADACVGCGACVERCPMGALTCDGERAAVDRARCIGCGVCVSTCPGDALGLVRKPAAEQPSVPRNAVEAALRLGRARGTITPLGLAWTALRSKVDRLLAAPR